MTIPNMLDELKQFCDTDVSVYPINENINEKISD